MKKILFFLFLPTLLTVLGALGISYFRFVKVSGKAAVIQSLREKTKGEAYPAFAAQQLLISRPDSDLLPLTGPSSSTTVFCRENQDYLIYQTDRFGFHNPDRIWDEEYWHASFVGDSFVQGACVPSDGNFVSLYGKQNGTTANLGAYGNGPLVQLASLIEYATKHKPKKVFWIYMQNDLYIDLTLEAQNPVLMGYLQGKSQNLRDRQMEIDLKLKEFLLREEENNVHPSFFQTNPFKNLAAPKAHPHSDLLQQNHIDWTLFSEVIRKAADVTRSWGGELYFVILPSGDMLLPENKEQTQTLKGQIRMFVEPTGAQILDLHEKFENLSEPLRFYEKLPGRYGHFTPQGYLKAAEFLNVAQEKMEPPAR